MSKPIIHAKNSARKFGGKPEDYLRIHQHMDSTKSCVADNRHRTLTHNSWYVGVGGPLELIFGIELTNRDGKSIPVRSIGEQHILEDFGGFIPTVQDFLAALPLQLWMSGVGRPPSCRHNNVSRRIGSGD